MLARCGMRTFTGLNEKVRFAVVDHGPWQLLRAGEVADLARPDTRAPSRSRSRATRASPTRAPYRPSPRDRR